MTKLLTPKQAASRLQVEVSTLEKWCECQLISYIKLPGAVRFNEFDLEAFVGRHRLPNKRWAA
jgi:excisionase family DNA binding protein